ncbi:MAG TPA: calcium-binding protein, partial [Nocardioidaceae bacterium]|nr:calcium-binding protein [Nocardioidaceae bacterium]
MVSCSFDETSSRLALEAGAGFTVGRDVAGTFVITDGYGNPVVCDGTTTPSVENVERVVIRGAQGSSGDAEVTLDHANGGFMQPGHPDLSNDIDFSIDLGAEGGGSLVIEGSDDELLGDSILVVGDDVNLNGDDDVDVVTTGVDNLEVRGNGGNDRLDASVSGFGGGEPTLLSSASSSSGVTLIGSDGDDLLIGSDGDDLLVGRDGDETLIGKAGDDTLIGNGGDDLLDGGSGNDTIDGGEGEDTADFDSLFVPVEANLGLGVAVSDEGEDELTDVENLIGTPFADL